jgi:hypothetical protein
MAVVAVSQQVRILDAAGRCLGAQGEELIRTAAMRSFRTSFDNLSYDQLDILLDALQREVPAEMSRAVARRLVEEIDLQCSPDSVEISEQLIHVISTVYGPSAPQFLLNVHAEMGGAPDVLTATHLPEVAEIAARLTRVALGPQTAQELSEAIRGVAPSDQPNLPAEILRIAAEQAGVNGEAGMRDLCRTHLEIDIEELHQEGLALLTGAINQDGGRAFTTRSMAAFVAEAQTALHEHGQSLRRELVATAGRFLGPASDVVVRRICARQGIPFDALTYEHIGGLALALRDEAHQYVGRDVADELMQSVAALLTDPT